MLLGVLHIYQFAQICSILKTKFDNVTLLQNVTKIFRAHYIIYTKIRTSKAEKTAAFCFFKPQTYSTN